MKKILLIIVTMGAMVAYGQTDNSATVSQTDGNVATIVQKRGATINATQLSNDGNGHINTIVANQFGENTATVDQDGKAQLVNLLQNGDGNNIMSLNQKYGHSKTITVKQIGDGNLVSPFSQLGQGNTATFIQKGDNNILGKVDDHASRSNQHNHSNNGNEHGNGHSDGSILHQSGKTNTSAITQDGNGNIIKKFHQSSESNTAAITQDGNGNIIKKFHQSSESNTSAIKQNGIGNTVEKFHQSGKSNTAAITQKGDANTVEDFRQSGQSNTAEITQKGASDNFVGEFTQKGHSNSATITQNGYLNGIDNVYIKGSNHIIEIDQLGNENKVASIVVNGLDGEGKGHGDDKGEDDGHDEGNGNFVKVYQDGSFNEIAMDNSNSAINVLGAKNELTIEQRGTSNVIDQVWLEGNSNDVTFKQNGERNKIKGITPGYSSQILGDDNVVYAEQKGLDNTLKIGVDVLGSDNVVTLKQIGDNNEFELTGSPFERNTVLVDQIGYDNKMETFVKGESNILKLQVKSSDSEAIVTQNGDENKVYAFNGTNKALFEGEKLTIDQQGNMNEIKLNTKRSEVTVLQNGNDYAEVDNSGVANIFIDQQADYNFVKLRGTGNGSVKFVQKNGSYNNINLTFNCDVDTDNVDITQDGSHNMVKGLGSNQFGMFCGSNLMITQSGNDNEAMIRSNNGSISLTQQGNSNVASITQSAN